MKNLNLILLILLTIASCSHSKSKAQELDNFFNTLTENSKKSGLRFLDFLKINEPLIYSQIESDKKDSVLLEFWGESLNKDGTQGNQIVDTKILKDLHSFFNINYEPLSKIQNVHAGITHTYGYIFSTLVTPYGLKRKRWIEPLINEFFDLKNKEISPWPFKGTLLSNVTYLAGQLSFKLSSSLENLNTIKNVSPDLKKINFSNYKIEKITEQIENSPHQIVTTLVSSKNYENDIILVYTFVDQNLNQEKLITLFPITKSAYDKLMIGDEKSEKNIPINLKYNSYWPQYFKQNLNGEKFKVTVPN